MTIPIYSALAGGSLIILQAILMIRVGAYRGSNRINLGTGDDPVLERRIRAHGNLAENAGLFVAVLALAEMTVVPVAVVRVLAIGFIVARLFHAVAMNSEAGSHGTAKGKFFVIARIIGAFGTFLSFIVLGGYLLFGILA